MDQENQGFPPAPASSMGPGSGQGMPPMPMGGSEGVLSQDEMRANLQGMMAKIDPKFQDFNSQKFQSDNTIQEERSKALQEIFDLFQRLGVDMNNPEEVRVFLDKLKETNPEFSQQLEQALSSILGPEEMLEGEPGITPEGPPGMIPDNMNMSDDQTPPTQ